MKKVTYFDVEWANGKNKSICQIGVMCEDFETDEPICPEKGYYVNPEDNFDYNCIKIHGITPELVKEEMTFPQIWMEVKPLMLNSIIIGHNVASADLDALVKCLQRYNLEIPELYYIDTYEIAKKFIPSGIVGSCSMRNLCKFYDISLENEHDAFSDACANKDLLLALKRTYCFDLNKFVHKYETNRKFVFESYVSSTFLRKGLLDLYGILHGISMDGCISKDEICYINRWKIENTEIWSCEDISPIVELVEKIIVCNCDASELIKQLRNLIANYYESISSSVETIELQVLLGILKGISCDSIISENECENLRIWLFDHNFLRGHFSFDKILNCLELILQDKFVTSEESNKLITEINSVLDPVNEAKTLMCDVVGRIVYLTGHFSHGSKSKVAEIIAERGGIIAKSVTKKIDILLVGDLGCENYSYISYGGNIKKVVEYNRKYSSNIKIIKESDYFSNIDHN